MKENHKTAYIAFAFVLFFIIAAFAVSQSKDKITGHVVRDDCDIECYDNSDCNDHDESTLDGCAYPGSCSSRCINEK